MPEHKFFLPLRPLPTSEWPDVTVHSNTEDGSDVTDDMFWTAFAEQLADVKTRAVWLKAFWNLYRQVIKTTN